MSGDEINNNRDSFVFYRSFYNSIVTCPENVQLILFRAVGDYALNLIEPSFDASEHKPFLEAIWSGIKPQLDANMRRYLNGCKGGCPKGVSKPSMVGNQNARKQNQNKTKTKPNDNENVNVNDNDKLSMPFSSTEFFNTWDELIHQPKWRKKTKTALQKNLDMLSRYDEAFAIELMNRTIANGWQGVVFQDTEQFYKQYTSKNQVSKPGKKPITSINELLRDEQ